MKKTIEIPEGYEARIEDNKVILKPKESENEKIRKEIYRYFRDLQLSSDREFSPSISIDEILAWLEKQGNNSTSIDIDEMVMKYSQTKDGDFGLPVNCMIRAYRQGINDALNLSSCIEKQGEQKPADKVESKFKVGDWVRAISSGNIFKILSINDGLYRMLCYDGVEANYPIEDVDYDLVYWTIQDAKEGDVLSFSDETIVIFKDLYNATTFHSYCHIEDGLFAVSKDYMPDWWEGKGFQPATKEQHNLLFQKMKEAGYEWDAEKKELKKFAIH